MNWFDLYTLAFGSTSSTRWEFIINNTNVSHKRLSLMNLFLIFVIKMCVKIICIDIRLCVYLPNKNIILSFLIILVSIKIVYLFSLEFNN